MIRTVWLAAGCLVVLGAMATGKVAKAPIAQTTEEKPAAGATVGADLAREPLTKADRLEVTYVHQEKPSQPTLQPIAPIIPEVQKMISPAETNIVSRHWHDPNAINHRSQNPSELPRTANPPQIPETARPRIGPNQASRPSAVIAAPHLVAS